LIIDIFYSKAQQKGKVVPMENDETSFVKKYCVRFGVIAVKKGYITEEALFEALKIQVEEELKKEEHRLIGTILYDMGMMGEKEIKDVVNELLTEQEESL
jgi:hypothetical protein